MVLSLCGFVYAGVSHVDQLEERVRVMEGYKPYAQILFDRMSGAGGFYFADSTEAFV